MAQIRTPSETLMSALEECETADEVMIIMKHKDAVSWHCSMDGNTAKLGLLEFVKTCVTQNIMASRDEDVK